MRRCSCVGCFRLGITYVSIEKLGKENNLWNTEVFGYTIFDIKMFLSFIHSAAEQATTNFLQAQRSAANEAIASWFRSFSASPKSFCK